MVIKSFSGFFRIFSGFFRVFRKKDICIVIWPILLLSELVGGQRGLVGGQGCLVGGQRGPVGGHKVVFQALFRLFRYFSLKIYFHI